MNLSIFAGDIADAPAEAICTSTNDLARDHPGV
jgi:hypothetical protein